MNTQTAINHRNRAIRHLKTVMARKQSHSDQLAQINEIRLTIRKCPNWVNQYFNGYYDALFSFQSQQIELCYLVEGFWYSTHTESKKLSTSLLYSKKDFTLKDAPYKSFHLNTLIEF